MKPAQIYTYTIPANGSVRLLVEGSFIKILACTGSVSVSGDFGTLGPILAGQGQKDFPSKSYAVNDLSGAINIVRILIADSGFIDDRVSGEVFVIDADKARNLASGGFSGSVNSGPVAAQYSSVQLWNPANSAKNIVVQSVSFSTGVADSIYIVAFSAIALATIFGVVASNKKGAGTVGIAELRQATKVGQDAYPYGFLQNDYMSASRPDRWTPKGMLIVPPGMGLNVSCPLVNQRVLSNYEWVEDAV